MNVLVTGAGLVGCYFAREMAQQGNRAVLYDIAPNESYIRNVAGDTAVVQGDIRDLPALIETIQSHQVEVVFHSAFLIGAKLAQRPYAGLSMNVGGTIAVAEAARLCHVRRLVFASTMGVYGDIPAGARVTEDYHVGGDHFYVASKVACEQLLGAYASQYKLPLAILRFAQIYGWGHYAGGDFAGPAVHEALTAALAGQTVRIDPGILTVNDYVYVKDLAHGVALACQKPLKSRVFNLGSGAVASTGEVAQAIRAAVPGARVEVLPKPLLGPFWQHEEPLDLTRSRQELGYNPQYDVAKGVADFAAELRRAK